jgi:hypothetical protein
MCDVCVGGQAGTTHKKEQEQEQEQEQAGYLYLARALL